MVMGYDNSDTKQCQHLATFLGSPAEQGDSTMGFMTSWTPGEVSHCRGLWGRTTSCCGCWGEYITSTTPPAHVRPPRGKEMTIGAHTQMLRQKFSDRAGNWYEWLQARPRHGDLRDSCEGLGAFMHNPPTPTQPPAGCWGAALSLATPAFGHSAQPKKASVDYTTVTSCRRAHSLTAYSRWMNTCRLSGAEREADLFPELATLISPNEAARQYICSFVLFSSFQTRLCCSDVHHWKWWGFWLVFVGKAGGKEGGRSCCFVQTSMVWISKPQP